ncbi:two-partner secretion domain-containing protein, partial [Calothrix sp. NIES-2098]|uniref:two-partner secretion domain-containing protein n=1 Tax=Calothrix sp. NIES-2098 TaxID=1954171 RepID=UPI0030D86CB4
MLRANHQQLGKLGLVIVLAISSVITTLTNSARAQIVPDGTLGAESTILTPNTNVQGLPASLIEGGATRGVNLFQSFLQFNVGDGQRVYFANPAGIENIFTRVTGSDPSKIFGTLGVDGRANLFFLNPNGIIFGSNARLDVAGSFLATTANSFVFENGLKFSATNPETAPLLTVSLRPGLQFGASLAGSISNNGNLNVAQDLSLIAGNLDLQGKLQAGRDLTLQAQDTVKLRDSVANPLIVAAGNQLIVQGDRAVDIFALNHPDSGLFSGSDIVLRSPNAVAGDAHYWAGGNFRIEKLDGNLGNLTSPGDPIIRASGDVSFDSYEGASLHILAGGSVNIGSIKIIGADATNAIAENVPLSTSLSDGTKSVAINGRGEPTLDIRAGTTAFASPGLTPNSIVGVIGMLNPNAPSSSADINIGSIENLNYSGIGEPVKGKILLTNQYAPNQLPGNIKAGSILNFGDVTIDSRGDIATNGVIDISLGVDSNNNILFLANNNITIGGSLLSNLRDTSGGNGGNITLISKNGGIDTRLGEIISATPNGFAGDVTIEAPGDIYVGNITAASYFLDGDNSSNGKEFSSINIKSTNGSVYLNGSHLNTNNASSGYAGDINISARHEVSIENKTQISSTGNYGRIFIGNSEYANFSPSTVKILNSWLNSDVLSGTGDAGNISVEAGAISLQEAILKTDNNGIGEAGSVKIHAIEKDISINNSQITSESNNLVSNPNDSNPYFLPGYIQINANRGSVQVNNSRVSTTNTGGGYAGNIIINALNEISLIGNSGNEGTLNKGIFSNGYLGNIFIGYAVDNQPIIPKQVILDQTFLTTSNKAEGNSQENILTKDAGNIIVQATGDLFLNSSNLETATYGSGKGGSIYVEANSVSLNNKSSLLANTQGTGKAGSVTVNATGGAVSLSESSINTGSDGLIPTEPENVEKKEGQGGGDINITANSVLLTKNSLLNVSTFGSGNSGNVYITADKTVSFTDLSSLNARTYTNGNAGNVNIKAQEISFNNGSLIQAETFDSGNAGNLDIAAELLSLSNASRIDAQTFDSGNAGNANIKTQSLSLTDGSRINADTFGSGKGGNITINPLDFQSQSAAAVTLSGADPLNGFSSGLFVNTESELSNAGAGGSITINTGNLTIEDGAVLSASSQSSGSGGNINVNVNNIDVAGGGQIITNAYRSGQAGNIKINATDNVAIAGQDLTYDRRLTQLKNQFDFIKKTYDFVTPENDAEIRRILGPINQYSGLFANTEANSTGNGGTIDVVSGQATIKDSARISVDSQGTGIAGSISITSNRLTLDNQAKITADTNSGQGGSIALNLQDLLLFRRKSVVSTTAGRQGAGGDGGAIAINLDTNRGFIVSPSVENNDISANAFSGSGGTIEINAKGVIGLATLTRQELEQKLGTTDPEKLDPQFLSTNDITAISQTNPQLNGIVSISSPEIDPSKGIVSLPINATDPSQQIAQSCSAVNEKVASAFVDAGRGGLPPKPDEFLSSDTVWEDIRIRASNTQ